MKNLGRTPNRPKVFALLAALASTGSAVAPYPAAAASPPQRKAPDCFQALRHAPAPGGRLVCTHQAWMTEAERADLASLTRGYLINARCTVAVDMDRRLIDEALAASDRVFTAPPQPVTCEVETSGGPMTIGGTFAPHVVFKDGFATDASPGLANITGVNSYLAMPVVAYVNRAPGIKSEMAAMINAFRAQLNGRQAAR
jgi:hypothetical protein